MELESDFTQESLIREAEMLDRHIFQSGIFAQKFKTLATYAVRLQNANKVIADRVAQLEAELRAKTVEAEGELA